MLLKPSRREIMLLANVLVEGLLQVLALIGIILTAGFLIFFIGDLLLAVLDPKYESILKRGKKKKSKQEELNQEEPKQIEYIEPVVEPNEENLQLKNVDYELAQIEEQQLSEGAYNDEDAMNELLKEEEDFKRQSVEAAQERKIQSTETKETSQYFSEEEFDENFFDFDDDEDDFELETESTKSVETVTENEVTTDEESSVDITDDEFERRHKEFLALKDEIINKLKEEGDWDD